MIISPGLRPASTPVRVRWDDPACPLCGGERRSPLLEAADRSPGGSGLRFAVVRCDECGLRFTSPRPDRETIGQFYPSGSHPRRFPDSIGETLTLADVLEHAHDPLGVLAEVRRSLPAGGRLTIVVPNLDCCAFRWFGPAWAGLDLPRHLNHFTPATLRRTLERTGFRVMSLRTIGRADWVRTSAVQAIRSGQASVLKRALVLKPLASVVAWVLALAGRGDQIIVEA